MSLWFLIGEITIIVLILVGISLYGKYQLWKLDKQFKAESKLRLAKFDAFVEITFGKEFLDNVLEKAGENEKITHRERH